MELQVATVVLEIAFDNQNTDHPANWDWVTLLDLNLGAGESVKVIEADGIPADEL